MAQISLHLSIVFSQQGKLLAQPMVAPAPNSVSLITVAFVVHAAMQQAALPIAHTVRPSSLASPLNLSF